MSVPFDYGKASAFAQHLACEAGKEILPRFRAGVKVDDKSDSSPVTEADRQSEAVMRRLINKEYASHGIVGEEYGKENENAEFVWVLDPVDGTKSFISGVPLFTVLVALLHGNKPVLSVIYQPFTNEMWAGAKGAPSTLNGKRISVRADRPLTQATMFCTDESMFEGTDAAAFRSLKSSVKLTRWSTDAYGYALMASGCADLVCEADLKLYDFAALVPVVENAGGVMTDWNGAELTARSDGRVLASSNPRLHDEALKALNG